MRNVERLLGDTQAEIEHEAEKAANNLADIQGLVAAHGWRPLVMDWLEEKMEEYEIPSTSHELMLESNGFRKGLRFVRGYFRELENTVKKARLDG